MVKTNCVEKQNGRLSSRLEWMYDRDGCPFIEGQYSGDPSVDLLSSREVEMGRKDEGGQTT